MSKCISAHGEYSEHEGTGDFCDWCGACNHDDIIAAAEQRGAIKALREAAESPDVIDHMYKHFDNHPDQAPAAVRAAASYLHDRADQLYW